jgi:hypothetical protein
MKFNDFPGLENEKSNSMTFQVFHDRYEPCNNIWHQQQQHTTSGTNNSNIQHPAQTTATHNIRHQQLQRTTSGTNNSNTQHDKFIFLSAGAMSRTSSPRGVRPPMSLTAARRARETVTFEPQRNTQELSEILSK